MDMLGWTPNKGKPITGQTDYLRVHLPNRSYPIMHIAQTGYPRVQCKTPSIKEAAEAPKVRQAELH